MPRWVARIVDICHTPSLRATVTKVAHPGDVEIGFVDRIGTMHAPVVLAREHPRPEDSARPRPSAFLAPVVPPATL